MPKKVNFSAGISSLGYGIVGVNLLTALENAGAEPALFPLGGVECMKHHEDVVRRAASRADNFHINGASLRINHEWLMAESIGKGPRLGYTFFEIDLLPPKSVHSLSSLDVLFVPSSWAADVVLRSGARPGKVVVASPGVDQQVFHPAVKPATLVKPTTKTTTVFNCGKFSLNKGHDFLLEAFNAAFTPADDVLLVVAAFNPLKFASFDGPAESAKWRTLYESSPMGQAGKIHVVPGRLPTQYDVAALMAACDVGFFPARAEGWNLEASECAAMGRNVILSKYSAHTEFAEAAGARLIEVDELEPAYDGTFFDGRASWARMGPRQLDQAVEHLRQVHREKQGESLKFNRAGAQAFRERFTWNNCAARILEYSA